MYAGFSAARAAKPAANPQNRCCTTHAVRRPSPTCVKHPIRAKGRAREVIERAHARSPHQEAKIDPIRGKRCQRSPIAIEYRHGND